MKNTPWRNAGAQAIRRMRRAIRKNKRVSNKDFREFAYMITEYGERSQFNCGSKHPNVRNEVGP